MATQALRAMAAARALERPARSTNKGSNRSQPRARGYNAQPALPAGRPSGYNGRPVQPQGRASGYNASPNPPQPAAAMNSNERSAVPSSMPPNRPDTGNTARTPPTSAARRSSQRSLETADSSEQPGLEPKAAYVGLPLRGDRFSRATARVRARLRAAR